MKIFIPVLLLISLFYSCSKSGQNPLPTPPDNIVDSLRIPSLYNPIPLDTINDWVRIGRVVYHALDIWFTSNTDGFITNDSLVFVTHDNGITWSQIPGTLHPYLENLQFLDDQNGFVQGDSQLGITNDGGNTWSFKSLPDYSPLYFQFVNVSTGFYADDVQGIKKTADAGIHWTSVLTNAQKNFPFYFLDSMKGFAMSGGDFNVTTNGGSGWTIKTAHVTTYDQGFYKMQFTDSSTGYCGTPTGLLKTIDGGTTWTNCLPTSTKFMMPYFFDAGNGYCISGTAMYKTTDGGKNWTISCQLNNDRFMGFHFLDMNTGWACTINGYILKIK